MKTDSEYDDDYTFATEDGVPLVPPAGKQVVDAPDWLVRSELSYDNGAFFTRLDANCTAERFYIYLNDACAGSYPRNLLTVDLPGNGRLEQRNSLGGGSPRLSGRFDELAHYRVGRQRIAASRPVIW